MVRTAKEGFEKVLADEDGTFAFIHEASQVGVQRKTCIVMYRVNILYEFLVKYGFKTIAHFLFYVRRSSMNTTTIAILLKLGIPLPSNRMLWLFSKEVISKKRLVRLF